MVSGEGRGLWVNVRGFERYFFSFEKDNYSGLMVPHPVELGLWSLSCVSGCKTRLVS